MRAKALTCSLQVELSNNTVVGKLWVGNRDSLKKVVEAGNKVTDERAAPCAEDTGVEGQQHNYRGNRAGGEGSADSDENESDHGLVHPSVARDSLLDRENPSRTVTGDSLLDSSSRCDSPGRDSPGTRRRLRLGTPRQLSTPAAGTPDPHQYFHPTTSSS